VGKKYRQTNGGLNPGTNASKRTNNTQTHQQHFSSVWKTEYNLRMLGSMLIPPAMMKITA